MPIADSTLILEGQQDFSGGMDSSLSPTLIGENAVAAAVNVTFRGGRPSSRPGLRQMPLSSGQFNGLNNLTNGYFHLERRPGYNSSILAVCDGNVVKIDLATLVVDGLYPVTPAPSLVSGRTYTIRSIGTTDFTLVGASSNDVGLVFTATASGTGTGTAYPTSTPSLDPIEKCYFVEEYFVVSLKPSLFQSLPLKF